MARHLRSRGILWSVLAAVLLLAIATLLLRDAIASVAASRALAQRGFRCVPVAVHLPLALPPSLIGLAATRCEVGEGPFQSIEFKEPIDVHLDRFSITSLMTASLEIDMRPRVHREVELNALGDLTRIVGLDHAALDLMFDTAELSLDRHPPLLAGRAVIRRAGRPVMRFQDFKASFSGDGVTVSSPRASVEGAALLGEGALLIRATPTAAVATAAFPGGLSVKIVLDHIDAARPKADFTIAVGAAGPAR
jgi:hypothetical protein